MFTIDGHTSQASSHSYVLESYPPRHSHRTAISSEIPRKSGGVSARWCPLMQQIAFLQPPTTRQDNNRTPFPKKGILHFIAHDSIIRVFYFILFYGMIYFRSSSTLLYTPQHISRPFPPRGNLLQYDTTRNHKSCHITKPCKSIHPIDTVQFSRPPFHTESQPLTRLPQPHHPQPSHRRSRYYIIIYVYNTYSRRESAISIRLENPNPTLPRPSNST